jgi:hypothetical protein
MFFDKFLRRPVFLFDADGGGASGAGGAGDAKPETKSYTQAELDAMFADRANRASSSAVADLLKKAGIDTVENLVATVTKAKEAETAQLSELEKANNALKQAQTKAEQIQAEADQKVAQATERLMKASVLAEATAKGFRPEAVNDVWLIVDKAKIVEKDGEFTGIKEAVEAVAKAKPFWLGDSKKGPGTPLGKDGAKKGGNTDEKKPILGMPVAHL